MRKLKLSVHSVSTIYGPKRHWLQSVQLYAARSTTPKAVVVTSCSECPLSALRVGRRTHAAPCVNAHSGPRAAMRSGAAKPCSGAALFLILSATHARLAPPPVSCGRGHCTGAARLGLVTLLQSFRALIGLCWCCLRSNRPARAHGVPPLRPSGLGYIPHAVARH